MLWRVLRSELIRQWRQPAWWAMTLLFTLLGFASVQLLGGAIDSLRIMVMGGDEQRFDSPFFVQQIVAALTFLGLPVTAWLFASAIHQEVAHRSGPLLWTTRLSRVDYWYGRWAAALVLNLLLFAGVAVGVYVGTRMPWLDPELFGAGRWVGYLYPYLITVLPRTVLAGTLVFLLVARLRAQLPGYLAIVGVMGLYRVAARMAGKLENRTVAALLDPSGGVAYRLVTRYWTELEKNQLVVPLEGLFLANRLLWTGLGVLLLLVGWVAWRPEREGRSKLGLWDRFRDPMATVGRAVRFPFAWMVELAQRLPLWLKCAGRDYRSVVTHLGFQVSVALGAMAILLSAGSIDHTYGTATWPVTYKVTEVLSDLFQPFALGILLFFCGHLVWQERSRRIAPLMDSTPRSVWLPLASKLLAMLAVAATLCTLLGAAGVLYQRSEGFFRHQLELYAIDLFVLRFTDLALFVTLALFLQVLLDSRWLAYVVTILVHLGFSSLPSVGLDHVLLRWSSDPGVRYSELNGYGHFLSGWASTKLLWSLVAGLMVIAGGCFWPRGERRPWRARWQQARQRLGAGSGATAASLVLLLPISGGWVFYNTNLLNTYRDRDSHEQLTVDSERNYRPWLHRPSPKLEAVQLQVDLFPGRREATARGHYRLRNSGEQGIEAFLLQLPEALEVEELAVDDPSGSGPVATFQVRDRNAGYQEVQLDRPLAPGEELHLRFATRLSKQGFPNQQTGALGVVGNGTFLTSPSLLPGIGYSSEREISDPRRRRHYGLAERDPLPPREDPLGQARHMMGGDGDWVDFEVVLSTEIGQVALAPGDLLREWRSGERQYFSYRSAVPILPFFAFVSGHYEKVEDRWGSGEKAVDLAIYFDPEHQYNVDTMMRGLKRSLQLYTQAFGPYPHRSLRIVEFPRYSSFAMSLPTLIPFSESIGFIARLDDPEAIDYPFYVTAHEVAHQWWPHQVAPAATEGGVLLAETLSQYSALRVMAEQYGAERMGRFLRYELDRYLIGRGASQLDERPLSRIQSGQQYLHYNKGALAMWSLAERIGYQRMDSILSEYLQQWGWKTAPYPTTKDFLDLVRSRIDAGDHPLLEELFERIVLYDLETREAHCAALPGGGYRVTLEVQASKFEADDEGRLNPVPLAEPVEIGVFGEKRVLRKKVPKQLYLERRQLSEGGQTFTVEVDSKPLRAGVDPYHKQIDRNPFDNAQTLRCEP